jgi:hypothetical protein
MDNQRQKEISKWRIVGTVGLYFLLATFCQGVLAASYLPGDIDGDGNTTLEDVIMGLQIVAGASVIVPGSGKLEDDSPIGMSEILHDLQQLAFPQCPTNAIYVSTSGTSAANGTFADPLDSLVSARDRIRQLKSNNEIPPEGITVCFRGGVYPVTQSVVFSSLDSGEDSAPVIYRSYPGETVIITGGVEIEPQWFTPVVDSDPVWHRLDETARANLLKVDLAGHGISNYGQHVERGFRTYYAHSPMEVSVNHEMMQLARWPNEEESDNKDPSVPAIVSGNLSPDVTGVFAFVGNSAEGNADDGYPNYRRQGLVDGLQYYLYHCTWQDGGARYWFISAYDPQVDSNCWPTGEWTDYPSWAKSGEETIPPLEDFSRSTGVATVNTYPEDFKENGFVRIPEVLSSSSFRFPGNRHTRWDEADDIWVQGLLGNYWADNSLSATISGNVLQLAAEPSYDLSLKQPFFVFNVLEELDLPGEYYIDRSTGMLYLYPPEILEEIQVSMLDQAIIKADGADNIQFKGLILELSRGDLVHISDSSNVLFEDVTLRNNGGVAARIAGTGNRLNYCKIYGSGGTGVELVGGSRANLIPGNNEVANSDIHDYARWDRTYKPAVMVQGVGNRVVHNHIHDAPHFGIFFYGNNHLFEYNRIERVTLQSNDAGAIYTGRDWGYRGTMIRYNFFKDIDSIFGGSHGVYFDDGASGNSVFSNIFYNINGYAVLSGGGRDNIVTNNIIVGAESGAMSSDRRVTVKLNNDFGSDGRPSDWNLLGRINVSYYNFYSNRETIAYQSEPWSSAYPELAAIPNDYNTISGSHWLEPEGCVFTENITWQTERMLVNGSWGGGGATDYFSSISPNISNTDPLFIDELAENLNLQPDSPAFNIPGFIGIPFDEIGIEQE